MPKSQIEQAVITLIQSMEVARDKDGWWSHPGIPDFDEDAELWDAWKAAQGLETKYVMLESESDDHPAYVAYFDKADPTVAEWAPTPPAGDGWFTFSIHDTEDGPAWVWARRLEAPYVSPFNPVESRVFSCTHCCAKAGDPHADGCPDAAAAPNATIDQAPAQSEGAGS